MNPHARIDWRREGGGAHLLRQQATYRTVKQSATGRLKQLYEIAGGSSSRICDPPGPFTMSLRNSTPEVRSRATSAWRSLTIR